MYLTGSLMMTAAPSALHIDEENGPAFNFLLEHQACLHSSPKLPSCTSPLLEEGLKLTRCHVPQ